MIKLFKNPILLNILFILLFFIVVRVLVGLFLSVYTHHGEQREMPTWVGVPLKKAKEEAASNKFNIVVEDSIFLIGQEGGKILQQNPEGGALVKRNRKVYVTVSKYQADMIPVAQLPALYGKDFDRKKNELENSFGIKCEVIDYEYDQGEPEQILRVFYDDREIINSGGRKEQVKIEKGGILQFILSKNTEGALYMPDLSCKSYDEAIFYLKNLNLVVGKVHEDGSVDRSTAIVYDQIPRPRTNIMTSDTVEIYISNDVSIDCN